MWFTSTFLEAWQGGFSHDHVNPSALRVQIKDHRQISPPINLIVNMVLNVSEQP